LLRLTSFLYTFFINASITHTYPLSLHDALPIFAPRAGAWIETPRGGVVGMARMSPLAQGRGSKLLQRLDREKRHSSPLAQGRGRSEEHTSELQSREKLVCRLLLEKKNNIKMKDR